MTDIKGKCALVTGAAGGIGASVVAALRAMPELRSLHSVSGAYDLIAIGAVPGVGEWDVLTDRIGVIDGVERTTSSIVLSTKFER